MSAYLNGINGPFQQLMWLQSLHGINDASSLEQDACQNLFSTTRLNRNFEAHRPTPDAPSTPFRDRISSEKEDRIQEWTSSTSYTLLNFNVSSTPVALRFGLCLPSACTQEDMNELGTKLSDSLTSAIQSILASKLNPQIYFIPNDTRAEMYFRKTEEFANDYWLNEPYQKFGAIGVAVLMSALVVGVIGASICAHRNQTQYYRVENGQRIAQRRRSIIERVSLRQSVSDLLEIRKVNRPGAGVQIADQQDLQMFDCFRVICLIWILTFGTAQFTMSGSAYNPWTLQDYFLTVAYTLVYSANLGFDEFFMLGAFFAYIKIVDYLKSKQDFHLGITRMSVSDYLRMYFSRFLRLAPVYYLVFLIGWLIGPYLNTGPWWYTYQKCFCDCQHYWWSVFTMTINQWPGYMIANEGCFYWGWYVASEMQLFLVIPILVYLLEFKLKGQKCIANLLIFAIICGGVAISFHILYSNNMAAGLFAPQDILIYKLWLNKSYTKFPSVALGLWLARLFLEVNEAKLRGPRHFKEYKRASVFGRTWVALLACATALGTLGFISIFPLSANKDPPSWSRLRNATFISLSRPAFLLALICLFYLLFLDYGQALKRFCARRFWAVLSRLSYGVYLVFPIVAAQFNSAMSSPLYLTYNEMIYQMFYNIVSSHLVAVVVYILLERPITQCLRAYWTNKQLAPIQLTASEQLVDLNQLDSKTAIPALYDSINGHLTPANSQPASPRSRPSTSQQHRHINYSKSLSTTVTSSTPKHVSWSKNASSDKD